MRVDAVELAALDQRGDHRPVFAAFIRAGEQGVFAVERDRPDRPLDCVVVEVDAAVSEEPAKSIPAGERVANRLRQLALGADLAQPGIEIEAQVLDDDAAALRASGAALLW